MNSTEWSFLRQVIRHPVENLKRFYTLHRDVWQAEHRPRLEAEFEAFLALSKKSKRTLPVRRDDLRLLLDDDSETSFDRHYLYHPAWAARVLARTQPEKHTDISSTLNFCSIVSAFIPVEFFDFRPAPVKLQNLASGKADLTQLHFADNSVHSLSCMHVLEHIGLGRYGDALDPDGDLKAIRELVRVLAPAGDLLIATPVGMPRIRFNAHRIYDFQEFRNYFAGLDLVEFALIPSGCAPDGLIYDPPAHVVRKQSYGCGCYWFRKPATIAAE